MRVRSTMPLGENLPARMPYGWILAIQKRIIQANHALPEGWPKYSCLPGSILNAARTQQTKNRIWPFIEEFAKEHGIEKQPKKDSDLFEQSA